MNEICKHNPPTQTNPHELSWVGLGWVGNFPTRQAWVGLKKPFNLTHARP